MIKRYLEADVMRGEPSIDFMPHLPRWVTAADYDALAARFAVLEYDLASLNVAYGAANARIARLDAELAKYKEWHLAGRYNVENIPTGIRLCRGDHEKQDACHWEEYAKVSP